MRRLGPVLASFLEQYPRVVIDLQLTDRVVDLVDENVDVAIRISARLEVGPGGASHGRCAAAPGGVAGLSRSPWRAQHPSDLVEHRLLNYTYLADRNYWSFSHVKTGEQVRVPVSGALSANNGDVLVAAAVNDAGIALQPDFIADEALASGALRELLPQWRGAPVGVYAVYTSRRYQALRVRRWIEHLALTLGQAPSA